MALKPKSFCGLLTLQVGAAILSAVLFTLASVILISNAFDFKKYPKVDTGLVTGHHKNESSDLQVSSLFVLITVTGFVITGILAFLSSYSEKRKMALAAMVIIIVILIYWAILSSLSIFTADSDLTSDICVHHRCPESFWLAPLAYRTYIRNSSSEWKPGTNGNRTQRSIYNLYSYYLNYSNQNPQEEMEVNGKWEHTFNVDLVAAIILFIINFIFMVYCALIMWGWADELKWSNFNNDYIY